MTAEAQQEDLLARTPDRYLADGFVDGSGAIRPDLLGVDATAAGVQLLAADAAPQELGFTLGALTLLTAQHERGSAPQRLSSALGEALATVARAIQQPNNAGLVQWLDACRARVATEADLQAFLKHFEAVNRQYGLLVALQPAAPPASS